MQLPAILGLAPMVSLGFFAGLFANAEAAGAGPLSCPPNIEYVPKVEIVDAPAGWQPRSFPEMHFLSGARLFDGDPDERVQLQEDPADGGKGYSWPLEPLSEGRSYSLVCVYEGTEVTFVASVPAGATHCTVTVTPEDSRGMRFGAFVTERERTEVICK